MEETKCPHCGNIGRMEEENGFYLCKCGGEIEIPSYSDNKQKMEKINERLK